MTFTTLTQAPRLFLAAVLLAGLVLTAAPVAPARAAAITVTTWTDENNSDGDCSLREAVIAGYTDTAVDACPAGSGADSIISP